MNHSVSYPISFQVEIKDQIIAQINKFLFFIFHTFHI